MKILIIIIINKKNTKNIKGKGEARQPSPFLHFSKSLSLLFVFFFLSCDRLESSLILLDEAVRSIIEGYFHRFFTPDLCEGMYFVGFYWVLLAGLVEGEGVRGGCLWLRV